jgi:hypothetical protein
MRAVTTHRTFKSDLYAQILARHKNNKVRALAALNLLEDAAGSSPALLAGIDDFRADIEQVFYQAPKPTWVNAIGLTATADIDTSNSVHNGHYELTVIPKQTSPYYKCVVSGPDGTTVWWKGCGVTETDAMESTGAWRHPMRRFFGLEARGNS